MSYFHLLPCSQEEVEDLRERMRVETGLIVVGSADDYLRVTKKKKKLEGITQAVVDKCITVSMTELFIFNKRTFLDQIMKLIQ